MSDVVAGNTYKILVKEIHRWQQESLITDDIAVSLLSLYAPAQSGKNLSGILMTVGAVLIGLGTILFIASNWLTMSVLVKMSLIVSAVVSAYAGGWYFKFEPGNRPKLGSALLLLGALLFGAGIWLISQIFNLDTNFSDGTFLWALGVLPVALLTRSLALGILSVILTAFWSGFAQDSTFNLFFAGYARLVPFLMGLLSALLISYRLRSRWCLAVSLVFGVIWALSNGSVTAVLSVGVACIAAFLLHEEKHQYFAPLYLLTGLVVTLACLTSMTFDLWTGSFFHHLDKVIDLTFFVAALGGLIGVAWKKKNLSGEMMFMGLVLLSGLLPWYGAFDIVHAVIGNAVLLSMLLLLMFVSSVRHKSPMVLNCAVVFLVIDIICRYFDFFFKTFDRSLFFVAGGFVFLIAATMLEHNRRQLLQGFAK
ncbi:MAG TPA: DUF2157 domain-containing protein [Oculatellaceae cyanobacterium]